MVIIRKKTVMIESADNDGKKSKQTSDSGTPVLDNSVFPDLCKPDKK